MRPAQGEVEVQLFAAERANFDIIASGVVTGVYADQGGKDTLLFTTRTGEHLTIQKQPSSHVVWRSKPD